MSSAAEKKCFRLVQEIVCERDRVCQRCGATPISGHHCWSRHNRATAFEPDSCLGLCLYDHAWAHEHPEAARELLQQKIGEERYEYLAYLSAQTVRLRDVDFREIVVELQKKLEEMRQRYEQL